MQTLREPVVRTGKLTMFYMAASLAFTAGGIILLYLLWKAQPVDGQTLNAVVFGTIIDSFGLSTRFNQVALLVVLVTEAGLLFVAANTGFLGGPQVLSNMASDSWLPHQFRHLSTRLVTQNGIVIMGLAALVILLWSRGKVDLLVVLYSINVFLTFFLSLLGLCIYWWRARGKDGRWVHRLAFSALGFAVTSSILAVTVVEKFGEGGWVTVVITSIVIAICLGIHRHYDGVKQRLREVDEIFTAARSPKCENPPPLDPEAPTAVFMVGSSRGGGIHTVLWVQRLFPNTFKNFIFISAKAVDAQSYGGDGQIASMKKALDKALAFYVDYCHANGLAATARFSLGTDRADELVKLAELAQISKRPVFHQQALFAQRPGRSVAQPDCVGAATPPASERHADGDTAHANLTGRRQATARAVCCVVSSLAARGTAVHYLAARSSAPSSPNYQRMESTPRLASSSARWLPGVSP